MQPFFGALADKFSSFRVLTFGGLTYSIGLLLMSISTTPSALYLTAGVMIGLSLSGASISVVIAAVSRQASVATMFGTKHMGSLYWFVFLSHQIGAFLGVMLGG